MVCSFYKLNLYHLFGGDSDSTFGCLSIFSSETSDSSDPHAYSPSNDFAIDS